MDPDFKSQLQDLLDQAGGGTLGAECLTDEQILLKVNGLLDHLPPPEQDHIGGHLAHCSRCQELVHLMHRSHSEYSAWKSQFLQVVPSTATRRSSLLNRVWEPFSDSCTHLWKSFGKPAWAAGAAALLVTVLLVPYWTMWRARRGEIQSVAVLPFRNASGDADSQYLAESLAHSVRVSLGRIENLTVAGWGGVSRYSTAELLNPDRIARDLHVRAVVTGELQRRGDGMAIQASLWDSVSGRNLWTRHFSVSDPVGAKQNLMREISAGLRLQLNSDELEQITKAPTNNPDAYRLYLRARQYLNRRDLDNGINYFQQAIRQDPNFAVAYAGLADCYGLRGWYELELPTEAYNKARNAAQKALELDPGLAEAHTALGMVYSDYDREWEKAENEYREAIRRNPSYPTAHEWYGLQLLALGRTVEGLKEVRRAEELDPLSPLISAVVGEAFYLSRDYDQALAQYAKALALDRTSVAAKRGLSLVYAEKGQYNKALELLDEILSGSPDDLRALSAQGYTLARAGNREKAEQVLQKMTAARPLRGYYGVAVVSAALGKGPEALNWLDRALQEHSGPLMYLRVTPVFDSLRGEQRFQDLVGRLKLPAPPAPTSNITGARP